MITPSNFHQLFLKKVLIKQFYEQLPGKIQKDTQIVLVSVDPERDTPELLHKYASAFNNKFIGVTADHNYLKTFALNFGAVYMKVGEDEHYAVDHTAKIFLISPELYRFAYFDKSLKSATEGFEFNIEQMVDDYLIIRTR